MSISMQKPIENASDWRTDKFSASNVMKWTSTTRWIEQRGKRARGYPMTQSIKLCGDWKSRTQKRVISEKLHIRHLSRKTSVIMSFLFLKTNNSDWIDLVRSVWCAKEHNEYPDSGNVVRHTLIPVFLHANKINSTKRRKRSSSALAKRILWTNEGDE